MQSEEEKRRLELYKQQIPRFVVQTGPSRTPKPTTQPNVPIKVKVPEYKDFGARITDVFNANSPQDIAKRQAANQPRLYAEQQRQQGVTRPDQNLFQALFREPITFGTTQAALSRIGTVEFPRFLAAKVTGNKAAEQAALERVGRITSGEDKRFQLAGIPSAFGQKALGEKQDLGQTAKRFGGAALGTASFAIGGGALPKLAQVGGKQGLKELGKFVAAEALAGGGGNIGATLTRKPEAGIGEIAQAGLLGGVVGGPLALGVGVAARGITNALSRPAGRTFITRLAETQDQNLIRESLGDILPNATQEELDAVARRLAQTTDETEIQRIIEDAATGAFTEPVRPTPTPVPEAPTAPIAPVRQVAPQITAEQVRNLLEGLPETSKAQFADEIAKSVSPEQTQAVITRIQNAKQAITQAVETQVPEAIPVTPVQRQQEALAQAVEQPTAPVREVAPTPVTQTPVQPTPKAVQGAVGPEGVQAVIPQSRFAIRETPEETIARLRARQAEAPIDQARVAPIDIAEQQRRQVMNEFISLPKTDFIERLAEQTGISAKWIRRALDKGNNPGWVYNTAMDSVQGAEDVNKVFNNRIKTVKFGVLPKDQNLSPLINKEVTLLDGTRVKVLDTNANNSRLQVEMPDGSVRTDVTKKDLQLNSVIKKAEPEVIKQEIPQVTDVNAPLSPTVIVDGNLVNKTTGEILEPPKNALDQLRSIPTYDKAKIEDFNTILQTRDALKERFNQWSKVFTPEELDNFKEELYLISRGEFTASEVSPRTAEMYNQIKPILDELYMRSKRVIGKDTPEMGRFEMYMSQQRRNAGFAPQIEFGYSTMDKANTVFGSANRRMNLLELEDIKDPLTGYLDYVDQWTYDNYNDLATAAKPEYVNTYADPVQFIRKEEEIIQKLAAKSDEEIADLNKSLIKDDTLTIDEVTKNFQDNAKPEVKAEQTIQVNGRLPRGASLLEDREILNGLGIYDSFGFKALDEADAVGAQIYADNFADIANLNREQIYERLKELYGNKLPEMPENADYLIRKRANSIFYDLNDARKAFEQGLITEVGVDPYHFRRLEKDLAGEKIYYNIQRADIKDKKVKELLNRQLERLLTDNRRIESFGEKVVNEIGSTLHAAMLGLKIPTAIQNLTETSRLFGLLDKDVLKELLAEATTGKLKVKETLQRIGQDKNVLNQLNDIPTNQKRITPSNLVNKARNVAMAGFDATEGIKDAMFLRGFELQGRKRGLSGRELGQYIAENYNKYAFKGGQFGSLGYSQNPIGRLLFQFSQYPIKQIKLNSKYAAQALSTDPAVRNEALRYLGRTFGTNAAAYAVLYPIFGWGMQRALGVDLPKFGPAVSLTVELYNIINDEMERVNTENERLAAADSDQRVAFDWQNILDRWGRKVAAYPIPGGDWLFNKLGVGEFLPDGYNPFSKNTTIATWQRGYEENYKGQARIEGPQNWFDYGTQFIGGQYNTAAARGYFGNNPFSFTIDVPGTAADIRIFSDQRLKPLNKAEQQAFDKLATAEEKTNFITQKHKSTRLYQELKKEFGDNLDAAIFGPSYTNTVTGERTVLDSQEKSIAKAKLLLNVPGLLEAVNMLNAESPLPIKDPFLTLISEHQKQFLRYQALEKGDNQKKALYEMNKDWMQPFMDSRDAYFNQFEIAGEAKKIQKDQFGLNPPELTDNIKSLRDRYFELNGFEARSKFLQENPSLDTYFKEKDTYDRNYNTLTYRPNVDPYPEADAETQQYLDEYNAAGPAATEGRKAVERSAWIKANPEKWKKVQEYFSATAMWSLQNELALTVYEGIEPSEKALKNIMNLAKGMGLGQFNFGTGSATAEDIAFNTIMSNLQLVSAKGIGLEPLPIKRRAPARFRVKVPSSRRTQQIRLR